MYNPAKNQTASPSRGSNLLVEHQLSGTSTVEAQDTNGLPSLGCLGPLRV
ncbi:uncharacterized protein LACBIDRAFT_300348 [Laccaria bicolor S238N-H82]|uniref:Predicted protein n=1 Tax=Laccaria bicolor (strain S238N-H82 / ATCC MYA-4686) TaxID=486041 RepID=B0DGJ7_LACBS|nr:uncharacterized protein LACBIDRAFT_300348 [Laccaria bicolor S238N-H82]EDR06166.1 predicted protein [Laccaria bicolor S238N-H82]|eukprot:XP_001883027.1 predicted protein [Laccaria bicolor S238N-H82]